MDTSKLDTATLFASLHNQALTSLRNGPAFNLATLAGRAVHPNPAVWGTFRGLCDPGFAARMSRGLMLSGVDQRRLVERQSLQLMATIKALLGVAESVSSPGIARTFSNFTWPQTAFTDRTNLLGSTNVFAASTTPAFHSYSMRNLGDLSTLGRPSEALLDTARRICAVPAVAKPAAFARFAEIDGARLTKMTELFASSSLFSLGTQFSAATMLSDRLIVTGRQFAEALAKSLSNFDTARLFPKTWELWEYFDDSRRIKAAFTAADLVPSTSMSQELKERVVEAYHAGASPDEIAAIVMAEYNADGCRLLQEVVDRLCGNRHLAGWEKTIRETLLIHKLGEANTISSGSLILLVEGMLVPFLLKLTMKRNITHNQIAAELSKLPIKVVYAVGREAWYCAIIFMETQLYAWCRRDDDPASSGNKIKFNRHRQAHAWAEQGTRENTLRCFLLLDFIEKLLDVADTEPVWQ